MKFILFVISILPHWAFSQTWTWSPRWVQLYHNKTAFEMCKVSSLNVKYACVALKITPNKTSKFQFKMETDNSLIISYKGYSTRLERTLDPHVFKVNRKLINIGSTTDALTLKEQIIKRLPVPNASFNLWLSAAFANSSFPYTELGTAITFMMMAQQEQEICQSAAKIIKSCEIFNTEFIDKMKSLKIEKPKTLEEIKKHQAELRNARMIFSQSTNFHLLLSDIEGSKVDGKRKIDVIKKCDCQNGLCKIQDKTTEFGVSYDICSSNIFVLHELSKKHPDLDEHIKEMTDLIYELEARKMQPPPTIKMEKEQVQR